MPFVKGNTIGEDTRFKTGQSGNPAGRPPDKLRRFIYAELDKVEREATGNTNRPAPSISISVRPALRKYGVVGARRRRSSLRKENRVAMFRFSWSG